MCIFQFQEWDCNCWIWRTDGSFKGESCICVIVFVFVFVYFAFVFVFVFVRRLKPNYYQLVGNVTSANGSSTDARGGEDLWLYFAIGGKWCICIRVCLSNLYLCLICISKLSLGVCLSCLAGAVCSCALSKVKYLFKSTKVFVRKYKIAEM